MQRRRDSQGTYVRELKLQRWLSDMAADNRMAGCWCGSQEDAANLHSAGCLNLPSLPAFDAVDIALQEAEPSKEATSGDEPIVASPEKKQRTSSPQRSPEDSHTDPEHAETDQKHAEPEQDDHEVVADKVEAEPQQTNQQHAEPQQPQQEAPKTETNKNQAKPQQPQHEEAEANRQPEQQQPDTKADAGASKEAKPASGMPAFPTPAEAAGAEVQQPVGEVTRLEDVTGVHQVR